jgi:hypothetical protein
MVQNRDKLEIIRARIREMSHRALGSGELQELQGLSDELRNIQNYSKLPKVKADPDVAKAKFKGKSKGKTKTSRGKKLNKYQKHISECTRGYGEYDGEDTKPFTECVALWRALKAERDQY